MAFDPAKLSPPGVPQNRIVEWHWPGGLRVNYAEEPTDDEEPYTYEPFPYTDQKIQGSSDYGVNWTEVKPGETYENITIEPVDDGTMRIRFPMYCGDGKIVAHCIDNDGPGNFLRMESNDFGLSWSTKVMVDNGVIAPTSSNVLNNQMQPTYAGNGEVFVVRPAFNDIDNDSDKRGGLVFKSTDYGDQDWTEVGEINAWNCRGITYIGRDSLFNRQMLLCVGDLYNDGTYNITAGYCPAVFRSLDGGAHWSFMQWIDNSANDPIGFGSGWTSHATFAYMGDGKVLLNTAIHGTTHNADSTIWKSTDYGKTWTKTFTFPTTEYLSAPTASVLYQYSWALVYCGKRRTEKNYIPARYHEYVYAWVASANSIAQGHLDQYLSEDGGSTWTRHNTLPQWQEQNTNPSYLLTYWWPAAVCFIEDNEALPGLYE
jgi:hypothetical protein